ncbi:hypothetical protein OIO90_001179 [Microbotryomycetes sp. JL221]|nr:hypothetical protein OIO90_001179 [Microbotryomycetes sp. JL221]
MARTETKLGKNKKSSNPPPKKSSTKKGKSSNYNAYLNTKMEELKKSNPTQEHKDRLKQVLAMWKAEQKAK